MLVNLRCILVAVSVVAIGNKHPCAIARIAIISRSFIAEAGSSTGRLVSEAHCVAYLQASRLAQPKEELVQHMHPRQRAMGCVWWTFTIRLPLLTSCASWPWTAASALKASSMMLKLTLRSLWTLHSRCSPALICCSCTLISEEAGHAS